MSIDKYIYVCDGCGIEAGPTPSRDAPDGWIWHYPGANIAAVLFHDVKCHDDYLNPPALSIHIKDGMGSTDIVGG